MGAFLRFVVEYVGNLDHHDHAGEPPRKPSPDRRTNRQARGLMDWLKEQMEARGLPADKKRDLVDGFRQVYRPRGPASGGVSATDGTEDPPAEWVAGTKGVSRDAPS